MDYKHPGVYIEEIPHLPPSIASVETAIPAFIGYTEKAQWQKSGDLINVPRRIESLLQYEQLYGYPEAEKTGLSVTFSTSGSRIEVNGFVDEKTRSKYLMHYSLQMFFANGGGPCWINSVNDYNSAGGQVLAKDLVDGLDQIAKINEVTLLVFPDAINLSTLNDYAEVYNKAIEQCASLKDRFTVLDVYHAAQNEGPNGDDWQQDVKDLQNAITSGQPENLKYAAVYFPSIYTSVDFNYKADASQTNDNDDVIAIVNGAQGAKTLAELKTKDNAAYFQAKNAVSNIQMLLPPSSAMVGIYAQVDSSRGVWKAPANVNIANAIRPKHLITNRQQDFLNVDVLSGKSINVIRTFEGRGPAIVWGARTLNGNDNEWRYIPVRRYFNMVEESVKNASEQFVFEPNDENTWTRIKSMIQNYLTQQWKAGALMGASSKEAFFVHVGLGETMTEVDIWEGRLIVEIGMAVVRPAEFIILRFMHKMLQES